MSALDRLGSADILQGTSSALEVLLAVDGVPTDPDASPAPSVTALDGAGSVLVATTPAEIVGSDSGKLRLSLTPALVAQVHNVTATWAFAIGGVEQSATTSHRVVGDLLFTLGEARTYDGGALASTATYPDAAILAARDRVAEAFAEICGVAFGARYARELLDGDGSDAVRLSHQRVLAVRSVLIRSGSTWTAFTPEELEDIIVSPAGRVTRELLGTFPAGRRNIAVEYEHGVQPIPSEIRLAALRLLRAQLVPSNLDDRATSQQSELGSFALATAGRGGSYFGLPLVDEVLDRYSERLPVVA